MLSPRVYCGRLEAGGSLPDKADTARHTALASTSPRPSAPPWEGDRDVPGAHLFQWQLPEQRQGAGEQPDEEGGRRAHDVDHSGGQHGDVGVLPGEGVDDRHHRVAALGQRAAARERRRKGRSRARCGKCGLQGGGGRAQVSALQPTGTSTRKGVRRMLGVSGNPVLTRGISGTRSLCEVLR